MDDRRSRDATLFPQLERRRVLSHPLVIGKLARGTLSRRDLLLESLHKLPTAATASHQEILQFVPDHRLSGKGLGYIDASLLVAVKLTEGASLWTRDQRLHAAAERLHLARTQASVANRDREQR